MEPVRRVVLALLFATSLLFVSTFVSTFVSHPYVPNLLLPVVVYYGLFAEVNVVRGTAIAFVAGNLLDVFAGSPMSLYTFLFCVSFLATRALGARLFLRNVAFQAAFIFFVALAVDAAAIAVRLLFELPLPFPVHERGRILRESAISALASALFAPFVYSVVARIEAVDTARKDGGGVAA